MSLMGEIVEEKYEHIILQYKDLLKEALYALNQIHNTKIFSNTGYKNTYELASAIDKFLKK
jgi:hypothetical protein